jgi:hypothetical protein
MTEIEKLYQLTDEDTLKRAHRIWVTELNSCPRGIEYRIKNAPRAGTHFTQLRGTLSHRMTEAILQDKPVEIEKMDFSEIPEAKTRLVDELTSMEEKIRRWRETTKIDLSEAKFSQKFELPLRDGFILVGEKDCVTPTHIIDFKSGMKKNTIEHRIQLCAYNEHQKMVDKDHTTVNVFFGDEEVVEFNPFDNPKTPYSEAQSKLQELTDQNIRYREAVLNGFSLECQIGILCAFCRSRAICNGF